MSLSVWSVSYLQDSYAREMTVLAVDAGTAYTAFVNHMKEKCASGFLITKIEQVVKVDINACQ